MILRRRQDRLAAASVLFMGLATCLAPLEAALTRSEIFDAQFVNLTEERSLAREPYNNYDIQVHEEGDRVWYNLSIVRDEARVRSNWKTLKTGTEVRLSDGAAFKEAALSFVFPFFGRNVTNVTLATAGAILTGPADDVDLAVPSHIAPFLTTIEQDSRDTIEFHDAGNSFTVEWLGHFLHDDHVRQRTQVTLYADGSMIFLYQNVLPALLDKIDEGGYVAVIGVQDGFAKKDDVNDIFHVYEYAGQLIDPRALVGNYTMVSLSPTKEGCRHRRDAGACGMADQCEWLCDAQCVYKMEAERLGDQCSGSGVKKSSDNKVECPRFCTMDYRPVCGSNGVTYSNECALKSVACQSGDADLKVTKNGPCEKKETVDDCPTKCPAVWRPVCGSDFVTHDNECRLRYKSCIGVDPITVLHEGACTKDDESKDYDYSDKPNSDDDDEEDDGEGGDGEGDTNDVEKMGKSTPAGKPCDGNCTRDLRFVCYKNKQVFTNECVMKETLCKENVTVADSDWKEGPCVDVVPERSDDDGPITCPDKGCPRSYHPVCASNGLTYENECVFRAIVCENDVKGMTIVKKAACDDKASERGNGDRSCPPALCTRELNPMCGSDDKTYSNKCLLEAAMKCDPELKLQYAGTCGTRAIKKKHLEDQVREERNSRRSSRAIKGLFLLAGGVIIAVVSVLMLHVYRRYYEKRPRQGQEVGIPSDDGRGAGGAQTHELGVAVSPAPGPSSPSSSPAAGADGMRAYVGPMDTSAPDSLDVAGSVSRAAANLTGTMAAGKRYDKVPLVPNMEEELHSDDEVRQERDNGGGGQGPFTL